MATATQAGAEKVMAALLTAEREMREVRQALYEAASELTEAARGGVIVAAYDAGIVDTMVLELEALRQRMGQLRRRMQEAQAHRTKAEQQPPAGEER